MFEDLLQKLNHCGQVEYETDGYFIRILPTTPVGFPVKMEWIWDTHFTVFLDGWHQDFDSYEEAVRCFTFGVSGAYRVKTKSKGRFRFRWTLEYWDGSGWVEDSTITDLFYPFWKPTATTYLHNDLHCEDLADASRVGEGAQSRALVDGLGRLVVDPSPSAGPFPSCLLQP